MAGDQENKMAEKEYKTKVVLACNTLTDIGLACYCDHMRLAYRLGREHLNIDFLQFFARRTSIDRFRNMVAKFAIKNNIDWIFFIDDDMQLPPDTFTKLFNAVTNERYDILCAFNYIRGYPFKIMAFKWDLLANNKRLVNLNENDLPETLGGVVPCAAIGTAVCLIRTEFLKRTPAPWFITGPHGTEDIYMCLKVSDYNPDVRIGMHTGVVTGHTLDPEVISHGTRNSLMKYIESYMTLEEIEKVKKEDPRIALIPDVGKRKLHYEDLMGAAYE